MSPRKRYLALATASAIAALGAAAVVFGNEDAPAVDRGAELRADFARFGREAMAPAADTTINEVRSTTASGAAFTYLTYLNPAGQQCMVDELPGGGRGTSCKTQAIFGDGPIFREWGSAQSSARPEHWRVAWVEGIADPTRIASVSLVSVSCDETPLETAPNGAFLAAFDEATLYAGGWPQAIIGRSADGAEVARQSVDMVAPDTERAKAAGATRPEAQTCS